MCQTRQNPSLVLKDWIDHMNNMIIREWMKERTNVEFKSAVLNTIKKPIKIINKHYNKICRTADSIRMLLRYFVHDRRVVNKWINKPSVSFLSIQLDLIAFRSGTLALCGRALLDLRGSVNASWKWAVLPAKSTRCTFEYLIIVWRPHFWATFDQEDL